MRCRWACLPPGHTAAAGASLLLPLSAADCCAADCHPPALTSPLPLSRLPLQSITALAHLRAAVLYIVDISEQCGFTIAQQVGAQTGPQQRALESARQSRCDTLACQRSTAGIGCCVAPGGECREAQQAPSRPTPPPPPTPSSPQATLFHSIKPLFANKPVVIVANKTDVVKMEDLPGGWVGGEGVGWGG